MQASTRTALVIGATGSIGREVAAVLLKRGWRVRALHRNPTVAAAATPGALEWVKGDAMRPDDVIGAASGTSLIVHAANPPNYRNWRGLALPMLDNSIAAAKRSGALILLPATVYNFGSDAPRLLNENTAQIPTTRKGRVRVEMELKLQDAARSGVRSIVVRAGNFFGPGAGNSWLTRGISAGSRRTVYYPGRPEVGQSWAYVPDLAETMVRLAERGPSLGEYQVFHFRGHWFDRGVEMAERVCRLRGLDERRIKAFPWWIIRAASPVAQVCREMLEMSYLWDTPLKLDNAKLRALIGEEPHTPIDAALVATLGQATRPASLPLQSRADS